MNAYFILRDEENGSRNRRENWDISTVGCFCFHAHDQLVWIIQCKISETVHEKIIVLWYSKVCLSVFAAGAYVVSTGTKEDGRHHHRVWKVLLNAGQVFCTSTHEILQHKTQTAPLPGAITLELLLHVLGNQSDSSWNVWWASLKIKVQMGVYGGYEAFRESLCTFRGHAGRKTWKESFLLVLTSSLTLRRMNDQCPDHMSRERKEDKLLTRMTNGEKGGRRHFLA